MRIEELTEAELLERIFPHLPFGQATLLGPGDDAAVIAAPSGQMVISTDVLVAEYHFRTQWSSAVDIGYRAAMQNLADIAAMGAVPTAIVVALVLPQSTSVSWVEELAQGLALACRPLGVGVVGGDLTRGTELVVAVTVHGQAGSHGPIRRTGAQPGDHLAVCGRLGRSAAGLAALQAYGPAGVEHAELAPHIDAFRRPTPPLAAGPAAAAAGASALMDISDGLLLDGARLAAASDVTVAVDSSRLDADREAVAAAARLLGAEPQTWVLGGGEDHALVATFPRAASLPAGYRIIGSVQPSGADAIVVDGTRPAWAAGWDHFRRQ